jgi:signal transduction histidine kinase
VLGGIVMAMRAAAVRRMKRRLLEVEREHALERERARIARDLHDDVGAGLTEIAVQTDWLKRDVERLGEPDATAIDHADMVVRANRVCTSAVELIRSVDAIVWAVNPQNDTLDRFVGYLTQSAEQFTRSAGVGIRLDVPEEIPARPVSGRVRHNLYLIVREALNNAVKHATATVVRLAVTLDGAAVTIAVADDGRGFDPAAATDTGRHSGLDNMRRRAEDIGGRLVIDSRPGAGTRIEVTAPLA